MTFQRHERRRCTVTSLLSPNFVILDPVTKISGSVFPVEQKQNIYHDWFCLYLYWHFFDCKTVKKKTSLWMNTNNQIREKKRTFYFYAKVGEFCAVFFKVFKAWNFQIWQDPACGGNNRKIRQHQCDTAVILILWYMSYLSYLSFFWCYSGSSLNVVFLCIYCNI